MKYKLKKSEFDNLSEELKTHYELTGDEYVLSLEGGPNVDELKRAKDREKEKSRQLAIDLKKAQTQMSELQIEFDEFKSNSDDNKNSPDVLQKAYERKMNELRNEMEANVSKLKNTIESLVLDSTSSQVAGEVFTDPDIFKHHIENRFRVDFNDDFSPKLVILDKNGEDSLLTTKELIEEVVANERFSKYIKGSNASGGGANGAHSDSGGAVSDSDISKMTVDQRSAFVKESPENAARYKQYLDNK